MKKSLLYMALSIIIACSAGCSNLKSAKYLDSNSQDRGTGQSSPPAEQTSTQTPSGPVADVPWTADDRFKSAQLQTGALVQMAAFKTVLKDPLPGEEQNVHVAARILAGTVVKPGQTFSMNNTIGPYSASRGFQKGPVYIGSQVMTTTGGGVCKMASTLYNVAVLSNLPIVERHSHSMPVPYVPYGQDATVSSGVADIKFKNDLSYPILIWAQGVENTLYVGFYGQAQPPQVEWHHQFLQRYKTWTTYRNNPSLAQGQEKTAVEGMDGAQVKSWVMVTNNDGSTVIKELGTSIYKPLPTVIEKNSVS